MNQELIEIFNVIGDPLFNVAREKICDSDQDVLAKCEGVKCENCLIRWRENNWYKTIKVIHEQTKQEESQ